jgi:hypothetical protein
MERFFSQENFGPDGRNAWDWLDDAVINSRGFVQPSEFLDHHHHHHHQHHHRNSEGAGAGVEAGAGGASSHNGESRSAIWHWHGYKANQIRCHFERIFDGSWDVSHGPSSIINPSVVHISLSLSCFDFPPHCFSLFFLFVALIGLACLGCRGCAHLANGKKTDKGPQEADVPGCHVERGSGAYPNALHGCYVSESISHCAQTDHPSD